MSREARGQVLPPPALISPRRAGAPSDIEYALTRAHLAMEDGEILQALRWADRAQRRCPDSPEIAELKARLLSGLGAPSAALEELLAIDRTGWASDRHALLAGLHLDLDNRTEATDVLQAALGRFAVSPGDPLALCASRACGDAGGPAGWIGLDPALVAWGGLARGADVDDLSASLAGASLVVAPTTELSATSGFRISDDLTNRTGQLVARIGEDPLLGDGLALPPDFGLDGRCWSEGGVLEGWVLLSWSPRARPALIVRDGLRIVGKARAGEPDAMGRQGFRVGLPRFCWGGELAVQVGMPDGNWLPLPTSPALAGLPRPPRGRRLRCPITRGQSISRRPVDVVTPVYDGLEETMDCLRSILASGVEAARLIIIDDASPNLALAENLRAFAKAEGATLIENPRNLGFPASVNRALQINPTHDVVILNADAEVYPGWLGRLEAAAYSAGDIGTVTPLSNAGAIASYPLRSAEAPTADEAAEFDRLAAEVNAGERVETPTGVGFCLYIRRDCLDQTGELDARAFGRGYGEENDFCLRAADLGLRHLIAADVFVRHRQSRSFGRSGDALRERNGKVLSRRHPAYNSLVEAFIRQDPLQPARRRLDEARLKALARRLAGPSRLMISLTNPGGVDRVIEHRSALAASDEGLALVLRPEPDPGRVRLSVPGQPLAELTYDVAGEREVLLDLLRDIAPAQIELHHFLDHDGDLIEDLMDLGGDVTAFIHDYSWVCPRLTLLGASGRYCGEPDLASCAACVSANGTLMGEAIATDDLRARSGRWLAAADRVVAPSQDVRVRLQRYFPDLAVELAPWETEAFEPTLAKPKVGRTVKVAVIGAIGEQKGYRVLLDCARDAAARLLPMEFVVIGFTVDDPEWLALGNTFVTGRFGEDDVGDLIRREAPDVAFFASVTPETHCFSLSHALRARLPIAAFDLGAIPERLRAAGTRASLLPIEAAAAAINTALLTLARDAHGGAAPTLIALLGGRRDASARTIEQPRLLSGAARGVVENISMPDPAKSMTASPQLVVLGRGLFSFSVKAASPRRVGEAASLILPALHVGLAPGVPSENVEITTGLRAEGAWLYEAADVLIVKVKVADSAILITSYAAPGLKPLAIAIDQLDAAPAQAASSGRVALQIDAHISRIGDVAYTDPDWVGALAERAPLEAFAIRPLDHLSEHDIEYKGLTAEGVETPWITGGGHCGSRGRDVALVGFSVRLRGAAAARYTCGYRALFRSGATVGPLADGVPAHGAGPGDALIGIQVQIREIAGAASVPSESRPAPAASPAHTASGPQFSAFRREAR